MHWCGTLFPNHAAAQDAEMSLDDYEDFVFGAMLLDKPDPVAEWQRISQEQERLVKILNQVKTIEMKTRGHRPEVPLRGPQVDQLRRQGELPGRRDLHRPD